MPSLIRDKKPFFTVEIDGFTRAAFAKCSELSMTTGKIQIREGGVQLPHKEAGVSEVADVTLERGKSSDSDFRLWLFSQVSVATNKGVDPSETYFKDFDIVQRDRNGDEIRRYRCYGGFITEYKVGPWDNDADEYVIEAVTIAVQGWEEVTF